MQTVQLVLSLIASPMYIHTLTNAYVHTILYSIFYIAIDENMYNIVHNAVM